MTGIAPLADVMRLAAHVDDLHITVLKLVTYLQAAARGEADPDTLRTLL